MEPDAREAAKRAARSAGMTLGAWLNQKLLESEGADEGAPTAPRAPSRDLRTTESSSSAPAADPRGGRGMYGAPYAERDFTRPAPELNAVGQSIDALRRHLQDEGARTERTFGQVSRSLEAMLAKLDQASARRQGDTETDASDGLRAIKSALGDVNQRLAAVETRRDVSPEVAGLERTVTDVTRSLDGIQNQTARRIDQVERNVDRIADRSEARDNRRMEAIRGLERAVTEIVNRVDDVARRQTDASREADRSIADLRDHLARRDNDTAPAIDLLRERIFELSEQLEAAKSTAKRDAATERLTEFEKRIAEALENTAKAEDLARLEARVTQTAETTVKSAIEAVQQDLRSELLERAELSEARTAGAIKDLQDQIGERLQNAPQTGHNGQALSELEERMAARFEQMSAQLDYLAKDIDARIDAQVEAATTTARNEVDALSARLAKASETPRAATPRQAFESAPPAPAEEPEDFFPTEPEHAPEPEPEPVSAYDAEDDDDEPVRLSNIEMRAHLKAASTRPTETGIEYIDDDERGGVRTSVALFVILLLLISIGLIGYSGWRMWQSGQLELPFADYFASGPIETRPANVRPVGQPPEREVAEPEVAENGEPAGDTRVPLPEQNVRVEDEPNAAIPAEDSIPEPQTTTADEPVAVGPPAPTGPTPAQMYTEALDLLATGNSEAAARLLEDAANEGFTIAEFRLATLYDAGVGVDQDLEVARMWYERAADGGNARAMYSLAVLYAGGRLGDAPDFAQAAHWFAEAAAYNIRDAQYNLGVLFQTGRGVRPDLRQAYLWFTIAELGGDTEAGNLRAALADRLEESVRARINTAAERWQPRPLDPEANGQLSVSRPLGASPAEIARAQELLITIGYTPGSADGVMGPQTAAAIRDFERSAGMVITGRVTPELISRLQAEVAARSSGG